MIPKEFPYQISPKLKRKLDVLIKQLKKNDVWILIDGDEGSGKTNMAAYILYYVYCNTNREFTLDRFYFDSSDMFEWVKTHKEGLVCWDEAALGGLSTEWWSRAQQNLLKFAFVGRKHHHFFVLCIPEVFRLKLDLKVRRTHALIHMDMGRSRDKYGNFMYLTRRGKRNLVKLYQKKQIAAYNRCCRKFGGFYGQVPYVFDKLVDVDTYEKKKDEAIASIGVRKDNKDYMKVQELHRKITNLKPPINSIAEILRQLGIDKKTWYNWKNKDENNTHLDTPSTGGVDSVDII